MHNLFYAIKFPSCGWFMYGNFDNKPGDLFEPNHFKAMKQCSHVDSQSTSRNISFAGRPTVAGT